MTSIEALLREAATMTGAYTEYHEYSDTTTTSPATAEIAIGRAANYYHAQAAADGDGNPGLDPETAVEAYDAYREAYPDTEALPLDEQLTATAAWWTTEGW